MKLGAKAVQGSLYYLFMALCFRSFKKSGVVLKGHVPVQSYLTYSFSRGIVPICKACLAGGVLNSSSTL